MLKSKLKIGLKGYVIAFFLGTIVFTGLSTVMASWPEVPSGQNASGWIGQFFDFTSSSPGNLVITGNLSADSPTQNAHLATKEYVDASDGDSTGTMMTYTSFPAVFSDYAWTVGGNPNYCSKLSASTGRGSEANDGYLCNVGENDEVYKCWDGACLELDNGGTRYCQNYNFLSGQWTAANKGKQCAENKYCLAGICNVSESDSTKVFITKDTYNGNLGGVNGAHVKCNSSAAAAGLSGTWKAWIASHQSNDPESTFVHSDRPYWLIGGGLVAFNWTDLTDGDIWGAINRDQYGELVNGRAWTNTTAEGKVHEYVDNSIFWCEGFTTARDHMQYVAQFGDSNAIDKKWSRNFTGIPYGYGGLRCSEEAHLYCFEQ